MASPETPRPAQPSTQNITYITTSSATTPNPTRGRAQSPTRIADVMNVSTKGLSAPDKNVTPASSSVSTKTSHG